MMQFDANLLFHNEPQVLEVFDLPLLRISCEQLEQEETVCSSDEKVKSFLEMRKHVVWY
jgi:hypothetical protein